MTNEEFGKIFSELISRTIPYLKKKSSTVTFQDIEHLYLGENTTGSLSPLYAIFNLRHSFLVLRVPITRDDQFLFNCCIEYAGNHLEGYSVRACEENSMVFDLQPWIDQLNAD